MQYYGGNIFTSINNDSTLFNTTGTLLAGPRPFSQVAISSNGSVQIAAVDYAFPFVSLDQGATWVGLGLMQA